MPTDQRMPTNPWKVIIGGIVLLTLATTVFINYGSRYKSGGIDFYSFWSIAEAQRFSDYTLGSPYKAVAGYIEVEKRVTEWFLGDDALFRNSVLAHGRQWQYKIPLLPTPLLYSSFSIFPSRFSYALSIYRWSELVLFVGGMLVFSRLFSKRPVHLFRLLILALLLLLTFVPLQIDLGFGNVNSFLFFTLVSFVVMEMWVRTGCPNAPILRYGVAAGLVFLALFKPLVLLPCLLLGLQLFAGANVRKRVALSLAIAVSLVMCVFVSSWYFRSWSAWVDWYDFAWRQSRIFIPSSKGNIALVMVGAEWSGFHPMKVIMFLWTVLIGTYLWAVAKRTSQDVRVSEQGPWGLRCFLFPFHDSLLLVSVGIVTTLATAPLVWPHYYVLAVIPAMWLVMRPTRTVFLSVLVLAVWLGNSELLMEWLQRNNMRDVGPLLQSITWVPIWIGILIAMRSPQETPGKPLVSV